MIFFIGISEYVLSKANYIWLDQHTNTDITLFHRNIYCLPTSIHLPKCLYQTYGILSLPSLFIKIFIIFQQVSTFQKVYIKPQRMQRRRAHFKTPAEEEGGNEA